MHLNQSNVNKFAISTHTALKLSIKALKSYLNLTCEYKLHILSKTKVGPAKDHGKMYMKAKPPGYAIFSAIVYIALSSFVM